MASDFRSHPRFDLRLRLHNYRIWPYSCHRPLKLRLRGQMPSSTERGSGGPSTSAAPAYSSPFKGRDSNVMAPSVLTGAFAVMPTTFPTKCHWPAMQIWFAAEPLNTGEMKPKFFAALKTFLRSVLQKLLRQLGRKRERDKERERERDRERQKERERDTHTQRIRERERERKKKRKRQRESYKIPKVAPDSFSTPHGS